MSSEQIQREGNVNPSESLGALRAYVGDIRRECQDLPMGVSKALDMIVDELVRLHSLAYDTVQRVEYWRLTRRMAPVYPCPSSFRWYQVWAAWIL